MDIITRTLDQAVKLLNGVRAKYIIVMPDGEVREFGGLVLEKEKPLVPVKKRKALTLPIGTYKNHVSTYIKNMSVADVVVVPVKEGMNIDSVQSSVCDFAGRLWGNGSVTSGRNTRRDAIEVLRLS